MSFLFGSSKTTNSSSTPTLTGQGQDILSQLRSFSSSLMNDPMAGLQPIQSAGEEAINNSYGNIPDQISQQMARRGYGSSGSFGNSMYQTQLGRLGSLGQYRGQIAGMASQRQLAGGSLADQMLQTQVGQTSTSMTKTQDPLRAFSALGSLLMMPGISNLFKGGGGGGGGYGTTPMSTDEAESWA